MFFLIFLIQQRFNKMLRDLRVRARKEASEFQEHIKQTNKFDSTREAASPEDRDFSDLSGKAAGITVVKCQCRVYAFTLL